MGNFTLKKKRCPITHTTAPTTADMEATMTDTMTIHTADTTTMDTHTTAATADTTTIHTTVDIHHTTMMQSPTPHQKLRPLLKQKLLPHMTHTMIQPTGDPDTSTTHTGHTTPHTD